MDPNIWSQIPWTAILAVAGGTITSILTGVGLALRWLANEVFVPMRDAHRSFLNNMESFNKESLQNQSTILHRVGNIEDKVDELRGQSATMQDDKPTTRIKKAANV